jgi:hypothetical protein
LVDDVPLNERGDRLGGDVAGGWSANIECPCLARTFRLGYSIRLVLRFGLRIRFGGSSVVRGAS